jgi:hypothetical protein
MSPYAAKLLCDPEPALRARRSDRVWALPLGALARETVR